MVIHHQLGDVTKPPASRDQIDSEQFFFAPEEEARFEAPCLQKGRPAYHRCARKKTQQRRPRHIGLTRQRAVRQLVANRVFALLRADQNSSGDNRQPGMGVEQIGRPPKSERCPPRIIIAECNVR
jgi:hypothetical protein